MWYQYRVDAKSGHTKSFCGLVHYINLLATDWKVINLDELHEQSILFIMEQHCKFTVDYISNDMCKNCLQKAICQEELKEEEGEQSA
jgi:hypothetical protein